MKNILAISIFLFLSHFTFAIGGVWVLEVEYSMNGKNNIGFVVDENWTDGFETYIGKDELFNIEFRKKFGKSDTLKIYQEIIDQEIISQRAAFPMHSFFLVEKSEKLIRIDKMDNVRLRKVWKKIDYTINVLTPLTELDTNWIGGRNSKEYPIGEEVGCRLEIHNFGTDNSYELILKEFCELYLKKDLISDEEEIYNELLLKLKNERVVVVELCGC